MANIILKNASKHFESVKANDQVNFEVKDGGFMVLVGPLVVASQSCYDR